MITLHPVAKVDAQLPILATVNTMMVCALNSGKQTTFAAVTNVERMVVVNVYQRENHVRPVTSAVMDCLVRAANASVLGQMTHRC